MRTFLIASAVLSIARIICLLISKRADKKLDDFVRNFNDKR